MALEVILSVVLIAFILQFFDVYLGMGYGTAIVPALILMNFHVLDIIPVILIVNIMNGIMATIFHYRFKNLSIDPKRGDLRLLRYVIGFALVGVFVSVMIATKIPELFIELYIIMITIGTGIFLLGNLNKKYKISMKRLGGISFLSGFNKGMTGGNYGALMVFGQIISGIKEKKSVVISTVSETLISLTGLLLYTSLGYGINLELFVSLIIGSFLAIPIAAHLVRISPNKKLRLMIGISSIVIGFVMIGKIVFG